MSSIVLSNTLTLDPAEAAAQRLAFLGASGSGKSYGCGRYVEQLAAAHVPVIVVDTVGIWPAVRLAADGKSAGLPFVVIGGDHADLPLEFGKGAELARFVVNQNASVVLDVSDYAPEERAPFLAVFFERLLIECKHQTRRRPRVVVYDEAQDLAPEKPRRGEDRMLKAVSALIRKGRNHLCGTVLLTQRPADVSKSALNLCGTLLVGAMFARHDRDAVRDWVGAKARSTEVEKQLKELPGLPPGTFYLWSPQWLRRYEKIEILPKWTFDGSSSTPLPGDAELGKVAPVDVKALRQLLAPAPAPVIGEPAQPQAVGMKIRQYGTHGPVVGVAYAPGEREASLAAVEKAHAQIQEYRTRCEQLLTRCHELEHRNRALELAISGAYARLQPVLTPVGEDLPRTPAPSLVTPKVAFSDVVKASARPSELVPGPGTTAEYLQVLLDTVVTYGPIDKPALALLSGKSGRSSTFEMSLSRLVYLLVVERAGLQYRATDKGRRLSRGGALPQGRALYDHYCQKLSDYDRKTFVALFEHESLTADELAAWSGHSRTSSTFEQSIARLKKLGLAERDGQRLDVPKATRTLMTDRKSRA